LVSNKSDFVLFLLLRKNRAFLCQPAILSSAEINQKCAWHFDVPFLVGANAQFH